MRLIYAFSVVCLGVVWASPAHARAVRFTSLPRALVMDPAARKAATALVGVQVTRPGRSKIELVALETNIGQVTRPVSKGKATWVATFTPPSLRFPTVALLRVDLKIDGKVVRRWMAMKVSIKLSLPVATKGAVDVSISVENREFGPVTPKKRQKEISIPVIIPPGAGNYTVTRITEQGVTSAQTKRFALPLFPRMVVAAPKAPPAGTTIRVDVFHVGAKGKRYTYNVPLNVDCIAGEIVKLRGQRSVQSIWIKLSGKTGQSRIRVSLKQEPKIAAVHVFDVKLASILKLKVSVFPSTLPMTSSKSVKVLVRVTDLFGNAARTPKLRITANGKPFAVGRLEPGLWRGWLYAPSARQPRDRILVRATAPRARPGAAEVRLVGDLAERLSIRLAPKAIMADGKRGVDVEILAVDRLGMAPKDRTIKVASAQGRMAYLHRVRPGLFRGRFIPKRNTIGGMAAVTASTFRAHAVSARVRLLPIPQLMVLSTVLGTLSDVDRAVGIQAGLRFEYSVFKGPPAVHIGLQGLIAPHFGVGAKAEADEFAGFSAGVTVLARLRLVHLARFSLDAVMDLGVVGIYASYKRYNPPAVDSHDQGRAAFTTSIAVEVGLQTLRQNEVFLQLRLRYLTASFHDASTGNHMTLLAGVGYRFEL